MFCELILDLLGAFYFLHFGGREGSPPCSDLSLTPMHPRVPALCPLPREASLTLAPSLCSGLVLCSTHPSCRFRTARVCMCSVPALSVHLWGPPEQRRRLLQPWSPGDSPSVGPQ